MSSLSAGGFYLRLQSLPLCHVVHPAGYPVVQGGPDLFFEHKGGVFHQVVYDNMRVGISQFVGKTEKHPTTALLALSRWYQFPWRFCNTA